MNVLVTGGKGFVGAHLVGLLARRGHTVVSYNRDFVARGDDGVQVVQGELFDLPRLLTALKDYSVDAIVHTAGMSHPALSIEFPVTTFAANAEGTLWVFEAARLAGVRRVVNFSSECAYGNLDESELVTESARTLPTTPYGVTKVTGELLGGVYSALYGQTIISLRITEVYGPGLWMPSVVSDMVQSALARRPFVLEAGSEHPFQFVYVKDVANAAALAVTAEGPLQSVYNVSGGTQMRLGEAASVIQEVIPGAEVSIGPGHLPAWDRLGPFDISAASRDLGYTPEWAFQDGLAEYVAWLHSRSLPQATQGLTAEQLRSPDVVNRSEPMTP